MKIPDLVIKKRLQLGESQREFGKRFGVSHASISDLERGKTKYISFKLMEFITEDIVLTDQEYKINCLWDKVNELAEMFGLSRL